MCMHIYIYIYMYTHTYYFNQVEKQLTELKEKMSSDDAADLKKKMEEPCTHACVQIYIYIYIHISI